MDPCWDDPARLGRSTCERYSRALVVVKAAPLAEVTVLPMRSGAEPATK